MSCISLFTSKVVIAIYTGSFLTGYNASIFAYGQTGSGKSYSMMGSQVTGFQFWLCITGKRYSYTVK
jgi:hypothetical protein